MNARRAPPNYRTELGSLQAKHRGQTVIDIGKPFEGLLGLRQAADYSPKTEPLGSGLVAMLPKMLEDDRWQAAGGSGRCVAPAVSVGYRELEAGTRSPSFETRNGICKLCGWKQTFTTSTRH